MRSGVTTASGIEIASASVGDGRPVVYVAGWGVSVPAAFGSFARIVLAHLWTTQRGPAALPMGGGDMVQVPGFSYAIPNRAAELLNGSQGGVPFLSEAYV